MLLAALVLVSCDPLEDDARPAPGTPVPGTAGIMCSVFDDVPIRVSPDSDWAVFWFEADRSGDRRLPLATPINRLALVDLSSFEVHVPRNQPPPEADSLRYPGLYRVCWLPGPTTPGLMAYAGDQGWYRVDFAHPDEVVPAQSPGEDCVEPESRVWWHHIEQSPVVQGPEITRGLHVEKPTQDSVALVLDDGRRLAYHESDAWFQSVGVHVSSYVWSPQSEWLAYRVSTTSVTFGGPPHSYAVPRSGNREPMLLQGRIWDFAWAGDDLLLTCMNDPDPDGNSVMQYWRMPE